MYNASSTFPSDQYVADHFPERRHLHGHVKSAFRNRGVTFFAVSLEAMENMALSETLLVKLHDRAGIKDVTRTDPCSRRSSMGIG